MGELRAAHQASIPECACWGQEQALHETTCSGTGAVEVSKNDVAWKDTWRQQQPY